MELFDEIWLKFLNVRWHKVSNETGNDLFVDYKASSAHYQSPAF